MQMPSTAARYQVLSVNDDRDFCECCGRTGLKRVVFIRDTETDETKHFGTTCAMSPVKGFGVDKEIKAAIKRTDGYRKTLNTLANQSYRAAGGKFEARGDVWTHVDRSLFEAKRVEWAARGFNY
jgi:hypothetical protein